MTKSRFADALTEGRLIKRYKRFLADIRLTNGDVVTAHCANPGSMKGLLPENGRVALSPNTNKSAKLDWRWEMVEVDGTFVGINTVRANPFVEDMLGDKTISELAGYDSIRREVKYGEGSRIDFLLTDSKAVLPDCYVEVKSVTLREGATALFPDSVTARGTKHLKELADMVARGHRAVMLYLVQRDDCTDFAIADHIDPKYGAAFQAAQAAGVEAIVAEAHLDVEGITFKRFLSFKG